MRRDSLRAAVERLSPSSQEQEPLSALSAQNWYFESFPIALCINAPSLETGTLQITAECERGHTPTRSEVPAEIAFLGNLSRHRQYQPWKLL